MKKLLLFAFLLNTILISSNAQTIIKDNSFVISVPDDNSPFQDVQKGRFTIRDFYQSSDVSKPGEYALPSKTLLVAIPPNSRINITYSNAKEEIYSNHIPQLNKKAFMADDSTIAYSSDVKKVNTIYKNYEITGYSWYREYYCAIIKVNPYRFDEGTSTLYKSTGIKIQVSVPGQTLSIVSNNPAGEDVKGFFANEDIAGNFKSNPSFNLSDTTGDWIDYSKEYVKLGTYKDALHRITKSDLASLGVPVNSLDPRTFKLYESGKEQVIEVTGQDDGTFDDTDYIQFFGTRNYGKEDYRTANPDTTEYREYLNRYSDTTVYFLTWGSTNGKRCYSITNSIPGLTDTVKNYTSLNHYEVNSLSMIQFLDSDAAGRETPGWNKNKTNYWKWFFTGTDTSRMKLPGVFPDKTASVFVKYVSGALIGAQEHQLSLYMNNTFVDTQNVSVNKQAILKGDFNSTILNDTLNVISFSNYANGADPNYFAKDWVEIEYPRYLKLNNDSLYFEFREIYNNHPSIVALTNASFSNYEIYKVKPFLKKINNYQVINNQIIFCDTLNTNDAYIAVISSKTAKPVFSYKKSFVNLRTSRKADYLAITHPSFLNDAANYVNYIGTKNNLTVFLSNIYDIYDEFSYGYPYPKGTKAFISNTLLNWESPKPSYLTIIGDGNYDYKKIYKAANISGGTNFITPFGVPVTDNWFSTFSDNLPLPQLKTGRIPINFGKELLHYQSNYSNNIDSKFTEWNKNYILFSSGNGNLPDEIRQFMAVHDSVGNGFIKPKPLAGHYTHFYKTVNPQTDFGPYSLDYVFNTIDKGGIFISYLGHSGTATWDNGIHDVSQIRNKVNQNPLATDFGCSTNKFAEPDITCFGELSTISDSAQAIGYIANSSLGFTSTSLTAPITFYSTLLQDKQYLIGNAQLTSKAKLFSMFGSSNIFKIFSLTNTLLGDPTAELKIPPKPNFSINASDFIFNKQSYNESIDSVLAKIVINNFGTASRDSITIHIEHKVNSNIVLSSNLLIPVPDYKDTLSVWLKLKSLSGDHQLTVTIDADSKVDEIYEDDNSATYKFNVASLELTDLINNRVENSSLKSLKVLKPVFVNSNFNYITQLSVDESFSNPIIITTPSAPFYSKIILNNNLTAGQRYWYRTKMDQPGSNFSSTISFFNTLSSLFYLGDAYSFNSQNLFKSAFKNNLQIDNDTTIKISVLSAGGNAGSTCTISKNGQNLLANPYFAGMGIAVFDQVTLEVDTAGSYQLFGAPGNVAALADFINRIPNGKLVVMGVSDDARNNMSSTLRTAIKTLGSTKIDQLQFRGSWAIIGTKGAAAGTVPEIIRTPYEPAITLDTITYKLATTGMFVTNKIGPAAKWNKLKVDQLIKPGTEIAYKISGIKTNGSIDSLAVISIPDSTADISFINAKVYPFITVTGQMKLGTSSVSPEIKNFGVDYDGAAELGTDLQSITLSSDTFKVGKQGKVDLYVYNAGYSRADSIKINLQVMQSDSTLQNVTDFIIDTLNADSRRLVSFPYTASAGTENREFIIKIDPENKINEFYKNNNTFTVPFYVQPDSTAASMQVTFDGQELINGDYVSATPEIKFSLTDLSLRNYNEADTTLLTIEINDKYISYNDPALTRTFSSSNPKLVITYKPKLTDGNYLMRLFPRNVYGQYIDSNGVYKSFAVSKNVKLLYVYNYPNPLKKDTYFTFKLTQVPDELKIRIYTIAGRLIKEIKKTAAELNFDFNRIYWDGKDQDGDQPANGVYLYKVTATKSGEAANFTQKMAIMR